MDSPDSACPTCGIPSRTLDARASFRRYACETCELEFWSPRVLESSFYEGELHHTYERRHQGERFIRDRHLEFFERARPGSLLDVGCGEGSFLEVAAERGFSVTGIDIDAASIDVARQRGLQSTHHTMLLDPDGAVVDAVANAKPFNWITAFEVLEHQPSPLSFLRAVRSLLATGGTFFGSVPNRDRILVDRDRARSRGDFPPHHFLWFSARALRQMLQAAGFELVEVYPLRERDTFAFASYLENSLLGGVTRSLKRRATTSVSGAKPSTGKTGRGLVRIGRQIKNLPFVPFAHAINRFAPERSRALFFSARSRD